MKLSLKTMTYFQVNVKLYSKVCTKLDSSTKDLDTHYKVLFLNQTLCSALREKKEESSGMLLWYLQLFTVFCFKFFWQKKYGIRDKQPCVYSVQFSYFVLFFLWTMFCMEYPADADVGFIFDEFQRGFTKPKDL